MLAKNDLEGKIGEKDDEVHRLQAMMKKSDSEVDNMQSMLEESAERVEHQRIQFGEKIALLDERNQDLTNELRQQMARNDRVHEDLKNSEHRINQISKRMMENEERAAEIAKINSEEIQELQQRLQDESEKEHMETTMLNKDKNELTRIQGEFDSEDHEKRRCQTDLRQEKHDLDDMARRLEDNKEVELDRLKRIEDLEQEKSRLQKHVDVKDDTLQACKSALARSGNKTETLKKELHDAEVRENNMYSQQTIDARTIHGLEGELKVQEEQHIQDANSVKLKIVSILSSTHTHTQVQLQDALSEKIHTIEKLEKAVAAMRSHAQALQMRLEQTEAESAHCQNSYENMLDEEQSTISKLRNHSEKLSRQIMHLRQAELEKDEDVLNLNSKLNEKSSENETLIAETYRKDRQAHNSQIDVQRLTIKEREMIETIDDLSETVSELRLQERETEHSEADIHRMLVEILNENKVMRHQIGDKMKAERVLLLELEAARLHVNDSTGHADAEQHAERALEDLLHKNTDEAAFD